ncbi:winged helix-turn-helix transcriptional regulator [Leuconostoc carnosum]|nr:winged helix-turn-helix transcriptional regulator [Leuconostoc carnosum]WLC98706.1 winged helix-turn-helix transcriptional regulator [Leuconostoc carnosum]
MPVKTEYRVTKLGSSLYPVIEAMQVWGTNNTQIIRS